MPRLVRGIHRINECAKRIPYNRGMSGWVYIMANEPYGTLYVGVTSDLKARVWQHREGLVDGFTKKHGLKMLVYAEQHDEIEAAIHREKRLKHWSRDWKIDLIASNNPDWKDLYQTIV
jgi:putative endonuclease